MKIKFYEIINFLKYEIKFSKQMNVLPKFLQVRSETELMYQKLSFTRKIENYKNVDPPKCENESRIFGTV